MLIPEDPFAGISFVGLLPSPSQMHSHQSVEYVSVCFQNLKLWAGCCLVSNSCLPLL